MNGLQAGPQCVSGTGRVPVGGNGPDHHRGRSGLADLDAQGHGWASVNWVASVGGPDRRPLKTPPTREGRAAKVGVAIARGERSIEALRNYRASQGPLYASNGVPYVVFLDRGSSAQAARGFVNATIARARRRVERQLRGSAGSRRVPGAARNPFSGRFTGGG